jgi:hypothetical protein
MFINSILELKFSYLISNIMPIYYIVAIHI